VKQGTAVRSGRAIAPRWLRIAAIACAFVVAAANDPHAQGRSVRERWIATWATAAASRTSSDPAPAPPPAQQPAAPAAGTQTGTRPSMPGPVVPIDVNDQTLRQIVRTTIGGHRVRVAFTNVFGTSPLVIGGAHVALRKNGAAIEPSSGKPLLFAGERTTTVPPGAIMVSDPADVQIPADADLAVDLYYPGNTGQSDSPLTLHNRAYQTSYVSTRGNHAGVEQLPVSGTTGIWHWLARVEVMGDAATFAIVAVGDSITDGFGSTIDGNTRWPDELRRRLKANGATSHASVLNVGIGGNQLLGQMNSGFGVNALARFDRDVLATPGVSYVVVLEGINDIGLGTQRPPATAAALIAAQRQLIGRAHAKGLTIYGGTLTPFEGANYWTPAGEKVRQEINDWIRTGKAYDGVIDFDAAVRDPKQPTKFQPQYHAGDWLHPNSAGYKAMAAAVDLKLFARK
jgi:lysophospholipase L1-like esterase